MAENGIHICFLLQIFAKFVIFVRIEFKPDKVWILESRNGKTEIKITQWVDIKNLKLTIVFQFKIVKLSVDKCRNCCLIFDKTVGSLNRVHPQDFFSRKLSFNVLEKHSYGDWNQILYCAWGSNWKVSKRNKVSLLSVEVDIASNWIRVCVESKENLIVFPVCHIAISWNSRAQNDRFGLKKLHFVL